MADSVAEIIGGQSLAILCPFQTYYRRGRRCGDAPRRGEPKSLHKSIDADALAAFLADERFDHGKAREVFSAPQCGQRVLQISAPASSTDLWPARSMGNRIYNGAARVALEIRHISAFLDDDATVAVRAGGDFVRDDQIAAFVLMHDLRL